MKKTLSSTPNFQLFITDVTDCIREDIRPHTGKVFEVYVTDLNSPVHICSLTPSYESWYIDSVTEKSLTDEQQNEWYDIFQGDIKYFNRPTPLMDINDLLDLDEWLDSPEEALESIIDYLKGNDIYSSEVF